jgi:hypothetical protein
MLRIQPFYHLRANLIPSPYVPNPYVPNPYVPAFLTSLVLYA